MGTEFWYLKANIKCPTCKKTMEWHLQTHFMGEYYSCCNYYKLNQDVPELKRVTVKLDGMLEDFCFYGDCPECHKHRKEDYFCYDFGAKIKNGKVKKIWFLEYENYDNA